MRQRDRGCASGWAARVVWSGGVKKRKLLLWRRQHQEKNSWSRWVLWSSKDVLRIEPGPTPLKKLSTVKCCCLSACQHCAVPSHIRALAPSHSRRSLPAQPSPSTFPIAGLRHVFKCSSYYSPTLPHLVEIVSRVVHPHSIMCLQQRCSRVLF